MADTKTTITVEDEKVIERAGANAQWLSENFKESEKGVLTMTKGDFLKFADARCGVTRDTLEAAHSVTTSLIDAGTVVLRDRIVARVAAEVDAGNDASNVSEEMRITTIAGTHIQKMHGRETFPVPTREGEEPKPPVTRFGRPEVRIRVTHSASSAVAQSAISSIEAAYSGKK